MQDQNDLAGRTVPSEVYTPDVDTRQILRDAGLQGVLTEDTHNERVKEWKPEFVWE